MALEIGSRLGHYDVTALIGEGGMGQVYQATTHRHPPVSWSDPDRQGDHAHSQVESASGTVGG